MSDMFLFLFLSSHPVERNLRRKDATGIQITLLNWIIYMNFILDFEFELLYYFERITNSIPIENQVFFGNVCF